ncbi:UNVERIFIED_CONTAM: hypothetical protein Slati_0031000 [Sesamum latifolium]|uniref:Uncharacterized protein n=1 Tax=Sesamum latifolium TaxID=2727402 RepID=A0AAW2Y6L8_9LAMI
MKDNKKDVVDRGLNRNRQAADKKGVIYGNCHKPSHTKESCFKLHRVQEWYKTLSEQRKKGCSGKNFVANVEEKDEHVVDQSNLTSLVTELLKLVKTNN